MADSNDRSFRVAAVQAAPVFLNRDATIEKACELIVDAGRAGARLIAFPASFVPTYPDWVWAIPPGDEGMLNELYAELLDQSVTIPSAATDRLCRAAKQAQVCVVMGLTERNAEASNASLYNTLLYIDPQGNLLGKHRKLVPTGDSAIVNPDGEFIAGPVREKEEVLYAEIDPCQMRGPKWMLDVAGHYARPDVFEVIVHREPRPIIRTTEAAPELDGSVLEQT